VRGLAGLVLLLLLAWSLGGARRAVKKRVVISGVVLQFLLALLLTKAPPVASALYGLNRAVDALQRATDAGTAFVFGYLGGGPLPFAETVPGGSFVFAFRVLPMLLVISALAALLFHWGIMQRIVALFSVLLRLAMGIGGPLGLGASVHIFVGHIEAPLLIRPYLARLSRGELFALMSCGMAGTAGTMMALYAATLRPILPDALSAIIRASVLGTPAALAVAQLMIPFKPERDGGARLALPDPPASTMDAVSKGTRDGIVLAVNVVAMLVVAIALVALVNLALGALPPVAGAPVSLQSLAALVFRPILWVIGIPWSETAAASHLMATKTVLNELVAYVELAHLPPDALSAQSRTIMIYALCGFANFGSAGIMIGGLTAMIPERRREVAELSMRSILSGTIATLMSGAVVGMI
jgi:CNT family concentrative nucleoside transporter